MTSPSPGNKQDKLQQTLMRFFSSTVFDFTLLKCKSRQQISISALWNAVPGIIPVSMAQHTRHHKVLPILGTTKLCQLLAVGLIRISQSSQSDRTGTISHHSWGRADVRKGS